MSEKEALSTRATNPLRNLRREVDRLFSDMFSSMSEEAPLGRKVWAPRMDMSETDKEYIVRVDLPGIRKEELHVDVEDHDLTIRGERKEEKRQEEENFIRVERSSGSFYRSVALPSSARTDEISADFNNGELVVRIPRTEGSDRRAVKIR